MISYIKKLWYHIWYHSFSLSCANDIIPKTMILRMISYFVHWYHVWYHKNNYKSLSCAIFMADIIYISYVIAYDISITRYHTCYCVWYMPLISVLRDIIAIRYHIFYDISAYVMVPARRAGAGWGRQAPGAPPTPATPSPICWGRVFNWTVTALMLRMDWLHWLLRELCTAADL